MARPLRLEHPGAIWHVTARGNERGDVFRDDVDREEFLSVLGRTVSLYGWRLHAYVLMGNHYHLLVETPEPTLSRGMRDLNGVTTQRFNRRHGRAGHLFEGRFKAILVERDAHLLEVARYVVLNPVKVGFARTAASWSWSSYKATAGLVEGPEWLDTGWTLEQFGRRPSEARRRYAAFVAEGKGSGYDPWSQLRGQVFLGSRASPRTRAEGEPEVRGQGSAAGPARAGDEGAGGGRGGFRGLEEDRPRADGRCPAQAPRRSRSSRLGAAFPVARAPRRDRRAPRRGRCTGLRPRPAGRDARRPGREAGASERSSGWGVLAAGRHNGGARAPAPGGGPGPGGGGGAAGGGGKSRPDPIPRRGGERARGGGARKTTARGRDGAGRGGCGAAAARKRGRTAHGGRGGLQGLEKASRCRPSGRRSAPSGRRSRERAPRAHSARSTSRPWPPSRGWRAAPERPASSS
ncbi:MAG: transposase [Holophagales bacterium]|nr:transposase [Holophagales bacterium]